MIAARLLCLALSLQARILFQDLPTQKICESGTPWIREFGVGSPCTETVQIARLSGLTREHKGEARLWLDDALLGPLRREHKGGGWESPEPVFFSAGKHKLSIECGDEAFEIAGVKIGEGTAEPSPSKPAPAKKAKVLAALEPTPRPQVAACPDLVTSHEWRPGRPEKALLLSVVNGREVRTPLLASLKRGEKMRWWFYVHPRPAGELLRYLPILLECLKGDDGIWILAFSVDHEEYMRALNRRKKDYEPKPLGYSEDKWTPLDMELCADGHLHLDLNHGEVHGEFSVPGAEMPIKIQSREIEIEIKGENK